jgi:AcrR family transcriptional regulator
VPKRRRRRRRATGEEARGRILEAATEHLRESGPEGLRLSALARELGVSHQAILYHFGSREGLVEAVVHRALESLQAEMAGGLRVLDDHERGTEALLDRAFEVLVDQGYGRLLAWVALSKDDADLGELPRQIELLAQMSQSIRERDIGLADYRDTLFSVMLVTYAILGAAVFERGITAAAGLTDDPTARRDFRTWLGALVVKHLETVPER